jgi:hypothetical protein
MKPSPSPKKTVQLTKDYIPRDQETEIPISSYQPLSLPLAVAGGLSGTRITHESAFNSCQRPNPNARCLRYWVLDVSG